MAKKFNKKTAVLTLTKNYPAIVNANPDLGVKIDQLLKDKKVKVSELLEAMQEGVEALGANFIFPKFNIKGEDLIATEVFAETAPATEAPKAEEPKAEKVESKTSKTKATSKPKAENAVKPKMKKANKAESEEPKAPVKKKSIKDKDKYASNQVEASMFPDTLDIEGTTFTIAHDINNIEDFNMDSYQYEFAFFWNKRHLKQFTYLNPPTVKKPTSFKNDLDLAQLIYMSDNGHVMYAVSDYTESMYTIYPSDLEEVDGLRIANGIEFQIYAAPVETEEA